MLPQDISELVSDVYLEFRVVVGRSDRELNDSSDGRDELIFKGKSDVGFGSAENGPTKWC
jgi:hypothetical protein